MPRFSKIDPKLRFKEKITPEPFSGCWLWTGAYHRGGYGRFWFNRRYEPAHRISWLLNIGVIPDGAYALHRCDTPSCVNPKHLFLGTIRDNALDAVTKGRQKCLFSGGEGHPVAKLTEAQVRRIRQSSNLQRLLASEFNVSQQTISKIKHRLRWRNTQ